MPVTIQVAEHDADPIPPLDPEYDKKPVESSQAALERLHWADAYKDKIGPIIETSLGAQTSLTDTQLNGMRIHVEDNGLVRAALRAYSNHHHLVLRPEDIWFAILTQFSFYVNANAEELRSSFVSHEGKKGLVLQDPGQADMGLMCRNMTKLLDENIVDPKLRDWILPSFSTTTLNDEVVASIIMMGTLQKYSGYVFATSLCGIPTVTLLGEQSDWEDILQRIEKLNEYGKEPSRFCDMLRPILKKMVDSFKDGPADPSVVDFWERIIDHIASSGISEITGWMVAFCFWSERGECLAPERGSDSWGASHHYVKRVSKELKEMLGTSYHSVGFSQVPYGFVSVPVDYIDLDGRNIETKLLAGFVGYEETTYDTHASMPVRVAPKLHISEEESSEDSEGSEKGDSEKRESEKEEGADPTKPPDHRNEGQPNTLKALTGWWMYEVKGGQTTGVSSREYFKEKTGAWEGGVSTGYVQNDGETVVTEDGLPRM